MICKHCGSSLHIANTIDNIRYWASNSGSAFCTWPMRWMRHELKP